jgi:hypothetical protein
VFGERLVPEALYLVDEHDDRLADILEDDLDVELDQPLAVADDRLVLPPVLQVDLEPQLAQEPVGEAVVPATRVGPAIALAGLPVAREVPSRTGMALALSVISITWAEFCVVRKMRPMSPRELSTGMPTRRPSSEPLSMIMLRTAGLVS